MKRIYTILGTAAAMLLMSVSCTDLNRLEDDLSSLENRVTVLEKVIPTLNGNIEALQKLSEAGTINKVELKDGVYTVTLSNGEVLTLTQGSIGVGNTPIMSVGKDGNWMVDYQDGKGAVPVLSEGNKVPATGKDGVTPQFGVDKEGFWTISYDKGKSFAQVLDENGKPVKALPEGAASDPFFKNVTSEGGEFVVVMNNGETLRLPVLSDFLCAIKGATELQLFNAGETKVYTVEMKGVASTLVTAPQGWTAALAEGKLTITAPGALTKAVVADSRTDVSILAISAQGLSTIAKVQVATGDTPIVHTPVATAAAGEATTNSLVFNVTVNDVTSWKYMLKKASEPAPDATELLASGAEGISEALTFTDLEAATEYVLYLLPLYNEEQGSVSSTTATTQAPQVGNDLYQAYVDGLEIEIGGQKLSKAVNGEPVLLTADAPMTNIKEKIHQKSAVLFLETPGETSFTNDTTIIDGDVFLIGRYADKKAVLKPKHLTTLKSGKLVLKNLIVSQTELVNNYLYNNSSAVMEAICFENCDFVQLAKAIAYMSNSTNGAARHISVKNCVFEFIEGKAMIFNFHKNSVLHEFKTFVFDNNLCYMKQGTNLFQLFNYIQDTKQTGTVWDLSVSICNNTFYNLPSKNGYFKFYQVKDMKVNKNIYYAAPECDLAFYHVIFYSKDQTGEGIDFSDNIAFGLKKGLNWNIAHSPNSTYIPAVNTIPKLPASPFLTADPATGTFVPTPEYAAYGVQNNK